MHQYSPGPNLSDDPDDEDDDLLDDEYELDLDDDDVEDDFLAVPSTLSPSGSHSSQ